KDTVARDDVARGGARPADGAAARPNQRHPVAAVAQPQFAVEVGRASDVGADEVAGDQRAAGPRDLDARAPVPRDDVPGPQPRAVAGDRTPDDVARAGDDDLDALISVRQRGRARRVQADDVALHPILRGAVGDLDAVHAVARDDVSRAGAGR